MKKANLLPLALFAGLTYGQVGVNTTSPKATLDITAKNTDGSTPEGILVPRLTGNALFSAIASNAYRTAQHSTVVYVTEAADVVNQTGQTAQVDAPGFYHFDTNENQWLKLGSSSNIYNSNGTLSGTRLMSMDGNNLGFTGGRIGMGATSPDPSAILDLTSTTLGFLPPRVTKVQMDAISGPATGLIVYCTDCFPNSNVTGCLMVNDSLNPLVPLWGSMCSSNVPPPLVFSIDCGSAITSGTIFSGSSTSGVNTTIPYSGGNGSPYPVSSFNSTGLTGLTATISAGTLNNGDGNLVFNITGTASSSGTANFEILVGSKSCTFSVPVSAGAATVDNLSCGIASFSPATLTQGTAYSGTMTIPYTGGNGQAYGQQVISNNGLTFTLSAGTLATGNGNLVYTITGTPTSAATMSIPINFGGSSCTINTTVSVGGGSIVMCGNSNAWAAYNLGANTTLDPNPSVLTKEYHGDYYQWGKKERVADANSPTGSLSGWNTSWNPPANSWNSGTEDAPEKTEADPCPVGFRVPTLKEWQRLYNFTEHDTMGTFNSSPTNYGAASIFKCTINNVLKQLIFPAAGYRDQNGALVMRARQGRYWGSAGPYGQGVEMYYVATNPSVSGTGGSSAKVNGESVRCISE